MDRIWWEKVPNAMAFIRDITESLLDGKSILLQSEQGMPWYDSMVSLVREAVMQQDSSKRFEVIRHVEDPGRYVLREYCMPEKRAAYRPVKSFAGFFAESDDIVLHTRYLWVHASTEKELGNWVSFVSEYRRERKKNKEAAAFILQWQGERITSTKKGIRIITFEDYINEYDRMVFSMLASSSVREPSEVKNYLAELASNIAENDIELLAACIGRYREFLRNPYKTICGIAEDGLRSNGEMMVYSGTIDETEYGTWRAQIKTIYPLTEAYRWTFVKKYSIEISKRLPVTSSYGELYNDPKDVELGTLVYMAENGEINIPAKDYCELKKFRDARNKLSHLVVLPFDEILQLLR